jgi:hypothetical protein
VLVVDMIEVLPPLGKYKYDTWRILPVKCYIDNFVHLRSCIRNINKQQTLHKTGKESHAYLDLQISTRTNLQMASSRQEVVQYFLKVIRYYRNKEMLVVLFNMGNHWVTLSISTKYDHI